MSLQPKTKLSKLPLEQRSYYESKVMNHVYSALVRNIKFYKYYKLLMLLIH
jgi:hypothetical protein